MSYLFTLAGIGAAHLLAAASPGPAFVVVTRLSLGQSRRAALAAAVGVANAAMIWALAATLGMQVLLTAAAGLFAMIKLLGGLYLLWLGWQAWRHAAGPRPVMPADPAASPAPAPDATVTALRAWRLGLLTNLANPKVIVFFGSIFVALFAPDTPLWLRVAAVTMIGINETAWYVLVALAFSAGPVQATYRRISHWVDRLTGAVMIAFGLRLIADARP